MRREPGVVYPSQLPATHLLLNVRQRTCLGCIVVYLRYSIISVINRKRIWGPDFPNVVKNLCNSVSISTLNYITLEFAHGCTAWESEKARRRTAAETESAATRAGEAQVPTLFCHSSLLDRTKEGLEEVPVHCQVLQIGLQTFKGVSPLCSPTLVVLVVRLPKEQWAWELEYKQCE